MKLFTDKAMISMRHEHYLTLIVFLMPALNFLGGINVDIYAPSMLHIAQYFNVSEMVVKNTITATILGWAVGAIVFGILIDSLGRKKTLVYGLLLYVIVSALALCCKNIEQLMLVRFFQGFSTLSISIGCRALVVDNIQGPRYNIAIVYTSIGYGLGPVVGPAIGGVLQQQFGWRASFIVLLILGAVLLFILSVFIQESLKQRTSIKLKLLLRNYMLILSNRSFLAGVILLGLTQIQMLLYPTLGPFVVQKLLGYSPSINGVTMLIVGAGYLSGNVVNRILLKQYCVYKTSIIGYVILALSVVIAFVLAIFATINLVTTIIPILLINISAGFLFSNIMGCNLKQYTSCVGSAMSIQMSILALIAAAGIYTSSHIHISTLLSLAFVYTFITILSLIVFFCGYCKLLKNA
jgi:MFS family permease